MPAGGVDIATLGLRVDASQVKEADAALAKLTRTGAEAERSTKSYTAAQRLTAQEIQQASRAYDAQFGSVQDLSRAHQEAVRWNQFFDASTRAQAQSMAAAHTEALRMNVEFNRMNAVAPRTTGGIGRLNNALIVMTRQAVGANAVTGQLTDVLGTFALGVGRMTAILAGLAALALAWRKITEEAREAKEAQEEALARLRDIEERRRLGPTGAIEQDVALQAERMLAIQREIARLGTVAGRPIDIGPGPGLDRRVQQALETSLARERIDRLAKEYSELAVVVAAGQAEITDIEADEAKKRLRQVDQEAEERERIAKEQLERDMARTREVAEQVEAMREFRAERAAAAEAEKAAAFANGRRKEAEATREAERAAREAERGERDRLRLMAEQIQVAQDYTHAILGIVDVFGLLSAAGGQGLRSLVQVGGALRGLQQGTLTGGQAGAVVATEAVAIVGAIVESGERQREAMRQLTETMDRLRLEVFAGPREAQAVAADAREQLRSQFLGNEPLAKTRERFLELGDALDVQIARITHLYREELEVRRLLTKGQDDEAARLRIQIAQERELAEARAAGWDLATLAILEGVHASERAAFEEERLARAREEAAEATKRARDAFEDLAVRALALTGQGGRSRTAALGFRQLREIQGAAGLPSEQRELLAVVHELERIDLATQLAIEAVQREAEEQTRLAEEQLRSLADQARAQERLATELGRTVESLARFGAGLSLGGLSPLSPTSQLDEARRQFEVMRALAAGGDITAAQSLPGAAQALLEASRAVFASTPRYVEDFNLVQQAVASIEAEFQGRLTVEEQMLAELQAQQAALDEQVRILNEQRDAAQVAADAQIAEIRRQHEENTGFYREIVDRLLEQIAVSQGLREDWRDVTTDPEGTKFGGGFNFTLLETQADEAREQRERQIEELRAIVTVEQEGHLRAIAQRDENTGAVVLRLERIEQALSGTRL